MRIATWNVERPYKNDQRVSSIIKWIKKIDADIVILTETNELLDLGTAYTAHHSAAPAGAIYKPGERSVAIYSRFQIIRKLEVIMLPPVFA